MVKCMATFSMESDVVASGQVMVVRSSMLARGQSSWITNPKKRENPSKIFPKNWARIFPQFSMLGQY